MTAYLGIPTGSNIHWVWNGSQWILQPYGGGSSGGGETAASYVVLSSTASLSNERILTAGSGISITDGGPGNNVTIGLSALTSQSVDAYNGYCTGSLTWSSTTWADFTTVVGNFTETVSGSTIVRSGSTWAVSRDGYYLWSSDFNGAPSNAYLAFRLSSSLGTLMQRTTFISTDEPQHTMIGILRLTSGSSFKLQYVRKDGASAGWNASDPIDGESMRTGQIAMFRIANPLTVNSAAALTGSTSRTFNFDFLRGTEVSNQGSGSMQSIGMSYYDQNLISGTINSAIFRGILAPSTGSTTAYLDLYDYNGIVTGIPNPISGAVMTGSSTTFTLLSVNLTSIFSSLTGSGLLDARIWCTPTGSDNSVICKGAWLEMKLV